MFGEINTESDGEFDKAFDEAVSECVVTLSEEWKTISNQLGVE